MLNAAGNILIAIIKILVLIINDIFFDISEQLMHGYCEFVRNKNLVANKIHSVFSVTLVCPK